MKALLVIAFLCLSAAALPRLAAGATTEEFGGYPLQTCSAGTQVQGLTTTQSININRWALAQFYPAGIMIERAIYWSPTAAGPYDLVWSGQLTTPASPTSLATFVNVDPGYLVFAQSSTASGTWNCRFSDGSPATTISTYSLGQLEGGAVGLPTPSWPASTTFALQSNVAHFVSITWSGLLYPPTLSYTGGGQYPENSSGLYRNITVDGSASSDPDGSIASWFIGLDLNGASYSPCTNSTCTRTFLNDDGLYNAHIRIVDNDGLIVEEDFTFEIVNLPPTATGVCDNGTCLGTEGDSLSFTCDATDPGWNDVPALSWDLDGVLSYGPTYAPGVGYGSPFAGSKPYPQDGSFSAVCGAEDDDGGIDADALTVTIFNADPVLGSVTGSATASEGSSVPFSTSATDPGVQDVLSYAWSWGDATADGGGASTSHAWADEGTYSITATVDDGDGGSDVAVVGIVVANVAPTLSATCPVSVVEGTPADFGVGALDPGTLDVLSWSLTGSSSATVGSGIGATNVVSWLPTYAEAQAGTVALNVQVVDGDGGSDSEGCSVAVAYRDLDGDGMPDTWESQNGLSPSADDSAADPDADGLSNLAEWQQGSDPQASGGPNMPVLSSPVADAEVTSTTPPLSWLNSTDPDGDLLTYEAEVYADGTLVTLVGLLTAIPQGGAGTTTATPTFALSENTTYWWRARADDGNSYSAWSSAATFFVNVANEPPGTPSLSFPLGGAVVSTWTPALQWSEVSDADNDAITYQVEVYADAALTALSWSAGGVVGGGNGSVEVIAGGLVENAACWWRARAADAHGLSGSWSSIEQFVVSTVDDAPVSVSILWPLNGGQVGELAPDIEVADGADPEGFSIVYELELALDAAFLETVWTSGTVPESGGASTTWSSGDVGALLVEDAPAWVRARSVDEGGLSSPWTTVTFTANRENGAPTVPTLVAPDDEAFATAQDVTFRLQNADDADGTTRVYDFEVRDDAGALAWSALAVAEGVGETSVTVAASALPVGANTWTARTLDELGLDSGWAVALEFEILAPPGDDDDITGDDDDITGDDDDSAGDDGGCACASDLGAGPGAAWASLLLMGALRRRRG